MGWGIVGQERVGEEGARGERAGGGASVGRSYEEGGIGDRGAGGEDVEEGEDLGRVEVEETEVGVDKRVDMLGLYRLFLVFCCRRYHLCRE